MEHLVKNHAKLKAEVYNVPAEMDEEVATIKLRTMGVSIDKLTPAQKKYLEAWQEGT